MLRKILLSLLTVAVGAALVTPALATARGHDGETPDGAKAFELRTSRPGPIFSAANMAPGDATTAAVTITKAGSQRVEYTLTATTGGDPVLLARIHVQVRRGGTTLYDGPVAGLRSLAVGRFGAGRRSDAFTFRVELRSTGSNARDNELQGRAATVGLVWSGVEA